MTERNKFEEMLEHLVNEDKEKAEELFHEIVVEKSRDIYENLLAEEDAEVEETTDEEVDEATDEEVDEASNEDDLDEATDEEVEEASADDAEVDEATDEKVEEFMEPTVEADPVDDMEMDVEMPDAGDDMEMGMDGDDMGMDAEGGEGDIEDRVMDLEDELESLKQEFEAMMDGDMGDEEAPADDEMPMDMDSEEGDEDERKFKAVQAEFRKIYDARTLAPYFYRALDTIDAAPAYQYYMCIGTLLLDTEGKTSDELLQVDLNLNPQWHSF